MQLQFDVAESERAISDLTQIMQWRAAKLRARVSCDFGVRFQMSSMKRFRSLLPLHFGRFNDNKRDNLISVLLLLLLSPPLSSGTRRGGAPFGGGRAGDEEERGRVVAEGQEQAAKTGRRGSRARSRVKEET